MLSLSACTGGISLRGADLGKTRATSSGSVLTDTQGMTLYTYDKDSPGKSNCDGLCAVIWPPAGVVGDSPAPDRFSILTRSDGSRQWAYDGKPLYGFVSDEKPGDTNGDGSDGVWHAVRP
ncbi:MAG: hypothetical protein COW30_17720 [Rhodospirillales bacterium CG15_BIG_FIL_POST_REV_8_21_14_020_66_15]|nr:MAG: hypothetical protein COW30_17720 [Rhodospirillales bacterium CG15_BIG_FIL_POST_REV_8_21_14_020_66_15]